MLAIDCPATEPRRDSYRIADVAALCTVRWSVPAGLGRPTLVGHSIDAVPATAYAGPRRPTALS